MRIAIVGSRSRTDQETVHSFVKSLPPDTIIVSGGADGPDTWAEEAAAANGMSTLIFKPDLAGVKLRFEATKRYYARNQQIADNCDMLVALVSANRKGGTEDTIRRATKNGVPVKLL